MCPTPLQPAVGHPPCSKASTNSSGPRQTIQKPTSTLASYLLKSQGWAINFPTVTHEKRPRCGEPSSCPFSPSEGLDVGHKMPKSTREYK